MQECMCNVTTKSPNKMQKYLKLSFSNTREYTYEVKFNIDILLIGICFSNSLIVHHVTLKGKEYFISRDWWRFEKKIERAAENFIRFSSENISFRVVFSRVCTPWDGCLEGEWNQSLTESFL